MREWLFSPRQNIFVKTDQNLLGENKTIYLFMYICIAPIKTSIIVLIF